MRITYHAYDGTTFETEKECEQYDQNKLAEYSSIESMKYLLRCRLNHLGDLTQPLTKKIFAIGARFSWFDVPNVYAAIAMIHRFVDDDHKSSVLFNDLVNKLAKGRYPDKMCIISDRPVGVLEENTMTYDGTLYDVILGGELYEETKEFWAKIGGKD